ncbi:Dolichyl-diphosphooligosaccharide-protein glycosyltransferase subunit dad1 [Lecanicillium sp. MT-2017a]|nr:Dolichyl-diphosphooligosaccharide-protein glycosyltransferase subunit dad1 [Lecanicillium sp. MT-2017a]
MTSTNRSASMGPPREKSYFEQQREALLGDIGMSFEQVLANINKLNRSLESIITVGNEFASVETLWSQFENVMAKDDENGAAAQSTTTNTGEEDGQQSGGRSVKREKDADEDAVMRG